MNTIPFPRAPSRLAFIGFGEAAQAFAEGGLANAGVEIAAYDIKGDEALAASYARWNVRGYATADEALKGADMVISVVTADQALSAATRAAPALSRGALFLDFNSVAPETKRAAARLVEAAGGRYVDVAVLSPVRPALLGTPLLLSGPKAEDGVIALASLGFSPRTTPGDVGAASAIKMIRSVMVKGLEALTAECLLAASAAGVREEVIASLDAAATTVGLAERGDYNLDRMMVHGLRRAAEMDEVVKTLNALGVDSALSRATAERQRAIGTLALAPPAGLNAKILAILNASEAQAA